MCDWICVLNYYNLGYQWCTIRNGVADINFGRLGWADIPHTTGRTLILEQVWFVCLLISVFCWDPTAFSLPFGNQPSIINTEEEPSSKMADFVHHHACWLFVFSLTGYTILLPFSNCLSNFKSVIAITKSLACSQTFLNWSSDVWRGHFYNYWFKLFNLHCVQTCSHTQDIHTHSCCHSSAHEHFEASRACTLLLKA